MAHPDRDLPDLADLPVDVEQLREVLRAHGVGFALLFGSHVDGRATDGSDVDVAVWGAQPIDDWALRGAVPEVVDLVDLRTAPDYLAGRIAMTAVVLLDDAPVERIRWVAGARKRHLDEQPRRDRFRADFIAAHGRR